MLLRDLINGLSSLIFPPVCKSCNKRIDSNRDVICGECWNGLVRVDKEIFLQKEIPENINKVYAIFQFDDLFQKIVHALKYQGNNSIGVELGKRMSIYVEPEMVNKEGVIFVPIPLHPIKHREHIRDGDIDPGIWNEHFKFLIVYFPYFHLTNLKKIGWKADIIPNLP